jgi:hypothetical protein
VQPNAGAAGFLRGTVAAENACRAHNEARTTERKARGKARSKARQAIDMVWGKARHSTALGLGTHTRDRRQRESPILKTAVYPCRIHISERCPSVTAGTAGLEAVHLWPACADSERRERERECVCSRMQGGVVELARQAAAAARAERGGARGAARPPVRRYRGVQRRGDMYVAEIMDAEGILPLCLGSYATPEEAACAYDAAARVVHGNKAKPNFPEPPAGAPPPARAGVLPPVGHARVRAPLYGHQQQPAPVGGGGQQRQAFPVPHFPAPPGAFSQLFYRPAAGPAFAAAAAAGGSNGAGFYGMAPMIGPGPEVPMPTYAASSQLSSSDKKNKAAVHPSAATEPKLIIFIECGGEPVVEDNFNGDSGASTSSAARPAVP